LAWHVVASTTDLDGRNVIGVTVLGRKIAVYRIGAEFYATSNVCTHQHAILSDGEVVDGFIECPIHYGLFEIFSGKAQGAPVCIDLEVLPVRVDGTGILVDVGSDPAP